MAHPSEQLVTVFGGSGFIGRHVVRALAKRGYRVRVAVRRPDLANFLQPLGNVGQIHAVQANLRYPDSVARAVQGSDAVVNLVGILAEKGRQRFHIVQANGAKAIADAAARAGISRFVQMSAIGADAESPSVYARSKAAGEDAVKSAVKDAIILRPSIVFGPEDDFFNRFAALARVMPALPLIGGGHTKFQPVFVGDVAEAVARAVDGALKPGATYELGGPEVKSFRELMEAVLKITNRKRALLPLPFPLARLQAGVMEIADAVSFGLLPHALQLTRDQVTLLQSDNVVSSESAQAGLTLEGMGIKGETIENVVPSYLYRFRKAGQFEKMADA
ncbi:MAG: complex I NDUFA9 subunit family protein [Alphaproteobacteria bacterium]